MGVEEGAYLVGIRLGPANELADTLPGSVPDAASGRRPRTAFWLIRILNEKRPHSISRRSESVSMRPRSWPRR